MGKVSNNKSRTDQSKDSDQIEQEQNCPMPRWVHHKSQLDNLCLHDFKIMAVGDIKCVLLDVRRPEEFQSGSIDGAININYLSYSLAEDLERLDRNKHYYVFCRSGRRSLRVSMLLKNLGMTVYNLDEGLQGRL